MSNSTSATVKNSSKSKPNGITEAAKEQAQAAAEAGADIAKSVAETAKTHVGEPLKSATDQGSKFVKENPMLAVAGAVGVGVLIGLAVRQKY